MNITEKIKQSIAVNAKNTLENKYPMPNDCGVYDKNDAEKLEYNSKKLSMGIFVLQISDNEWISSSNYNFYTGSFTSSGEPLTKDEVFKTKELALIFAISKLREDMNNFYSESCKEQQSEAKKALAWLDDKEKDLEFWQEMKQPKQELLPGDLTLFSELNQDEKEELKACESVIEKNLQGFLEVGEALINIKENKLYRAKFKTFEEYCQQKWNFTSRYARNLIQSAELIDELQSGTIVPKILPKTEGQARELLKVVDPKKRIDVLNNVAEALESGEKLTANLVREKAEEYISDAKPTADKKTPGLNKTINVDDQIPGQLDLVEEINKTEVITIAPPSNVEKKIIELEVLVKKTLPALRITQEIINRSLKVLGVSKADFAIQDHLTGPYIPASNQDNNDFIDFNGRGIINLLTDENLFKYFADVMTNISIGNTFECIIFVKAIFNTSYFEAMLSYSEVWAGLKLNEPYPVAAFYFGPYPNKFTQEFQDVGLLMSKFLMQEAN